MRRKKGFLSLLENNKNLQLFVVLFACFLLKYIIYGFCYYPALDDYIQYGGYPLYGDASYVLFGIGTASSRPLAAILDIFLWGNLWKTPHLMLILNMLFHFSSCLLFYKAAKENHITLSPIFAVFYLFFPLGFEATYWISASSRIILGLLFCSVALVAVSKFVKTGKILYFILFFICSLLCFSLYESCAVFCFVTTIIILILNKNIKRSILPALSLCLLLALLLFYMNVAQNVGMMGSRASDASFSLIFTQLGDFFIQFYETVIKGGIITTINGFSSGLLLLFEKNVFGILYIGAICLLCVILGRISASIAYKKPSSRAISARLLSGIILIIAPFAPNMITEPLWITYRTVFVPMIGLYMIFDVLFKAIPKKSIQTILLTSLLFIFTVSSVNEYDTYKRTSELDKALLTKVCDELSNEVKTGACEAVVLLDDVPSVPQVSLYKDHVKSVFYSDWSLTGAVRATLENLSVKKVTPVYPDMTFDYSDCFIIDLRSDK